MLHDELRPRGIHVAHTAIGGAIGAGKDHEPDEIADLLWRHTPTATASRPASESTDRRPATGGPVQPLTVHEWLNPRQSA
jgi:hypothetical protein